MSPRVHLVHRTRDRVRLRIPEKRKDLRYFLGLYDSLRQIPGIADVEINPVTGSVLLRFPSEVADSVFATLYQIGLLRVDAEALTWPREPGRIGHFLSSHRIGAIDIRAVLLVLLVALVIHQIRRGVLLVPALSVLWYAYDLLISYRKERARCQTATATPSVNPAT